MSESRLGLHSKAIVEHVFNEERHAYRSDSLLDEVVENVESIVH